MRPLNTEKVLNELLADSNKICFIYDLDSQAIRFLNSSFYALFGSEAKHLAEEPVRLLDFIHPDDREMIRTRCEELVNGLRIEKMEFRIMSSDESVRHIVLFPKLVTEEQGERYLAGLAEDVTLENENAETLHRFAAKKNSILEILSHDLAGSLGIIQSLAGLLAETVQDFKNDEVNNMIRIIQRSSANSIQMIRDFVQQEFLASAKSGLVKKRVDLIVKLREVIDQYDDEEDKIRKHISLEISSKPVFVYLDENKFMQVINNLLSNSIKFTPDGGKINVQVEEKEATVLIIVKDTGIGIPLKYHDELFEKFTRARREGLKGEPSTGLGMSIIKTIVEWHQGKIWFESTPGVGSTFYIEIPKE